MEEYECTTRNRQVLKEVSEVPGAKQSQEGLTKTPSSKEQWTRGPVDSSEAQTLLCTCGSSPTPALSRASPEQSLTPA